MMAPFLASIVAAAVALSGYPATDVDINVEHRSHVEMVKMAGCNDDCPIMGLVMFDSPHTVQLDDRLHPERNVHDRSILIHEVIHVLQFIAGKTQHDCPTWLANEKEAYRLQRNYLESEGRYISPSLTPAFVEC